MHAGFNTGAVVSVFGSAFHANALRQVSANGQAVLMQCE
jgi:hypothetical protein